MDIDDTTLSAYGIVLSDEDKQEFFAQLQSNLEEIVGLKIIEKLDDEQAKILMDINAGGDGEQVVAWLEQNVPDYQAIVQQELDTLLKEVAEAQAKQ